MKKILIVDDSKTARLMFKANFPKDRGFTFYEADGYRTALPIAVETQPDIIILDYNMPDKHGIDVAREIIGAGVSTKFVLATANLQKSIIDAAKELNFSAFLEKPITTEKIESVLNELNL